MARWMEDALMAKTSRKAAAATGPRPARQMEGALKKRTAPLPVNHSLLTLF
jgi:hypothetical protein